VGHFKIGNPYQIAGRTHVPKVDKRYREVGIASWYGADFHKGVTANGERFNMHSMTAAHRTLPMPSIVRVTNKSNGKSVVLRVNDRGPFVGDRIIDVSKRAAQELGFKEKGIQKVLVEIMPRESHAAQQQAMRVGGSFQGAVPTVPPRPGYFAARGTQTAAPAVSSRPTYFAARETRTAEPAAPQAPRPTYFAESDMQTVASIPHGRTATLDQSQPFIQVGSFTSRETADTLARDINGFTQEATIDGQSFYRVQIGGFRSATDAEQALERIRTNGFPEAELFNAGG